MILMTTLTDACDDSTWMHPPQAGCHQCFHSCLTRCRINWERGFPSVVGCGQLTPQTLHSDYISPKICLLTFKESIEQQWW